MKSLIKFRLEQMKTENYKKQQSIRLEKIKDLRNRPGIKTSKQYLAMVNSVCGKTRIESRQKIDRLRKSNI